MRTLFRQAREPISSLTHAIGAVFWAFGALVLVIYSLFVANISTVTWIGAGVFFLSLIALYSTSAIYHFANTTARRLLRLRKLDHSMIYVLIAGTYTPIALTFMERMHGLVFLAVIWSIAAVGIVTKLAWLEAPRWLSTGFYLLMGWAIVFDYKGFSGIPGSTLFWIAAGGIFYSFGAVCYIIKKPNLSPAWGFHEIFHLFVISGSLMHVLAVLLFVL